jgi:hypothetical protein
VSGVVLVNGCIPAKRGVYAAFRRWINATYGSAELIRGVEIGKWRAGIHGQYGNRTRLYGDWLYHQDRAMFDEWLWRALQGRDCDGFDWNAWLAATPEAE